MTTCLAPQNSPLEASGSTSTPTHSSRFAEIDWHKAAWYLEGKNGIRYRLGASEVSRQSLALPTGRVIGAQYGAAPAETVARSEVVLKMKEKLGNGAYGEVYRVSVRCSRAQGLSNLAFKTGVVVDEREKQDLQQEVGFWRHIYGELGPAQVSFNRDSKGEQRYSLVCPYFSGKTLTAYLRSRAISFEERLKLLDAVLKRLAWLHEEKEVIHGDLHSGNIMLAEHGSDYKVEFVDFGFSYSAGGMASTIDYEADETCWHPDRCCERDDLPANAWHDVYSLVRCFVKFHPESFPFLRHFHFSDQPSSVAEVRAAVQARLFVERSAPNIKVGVEALEALLFSNGDQENEFNAEIKPENFASYETLLTWFKSKYPSQYNELTVAHIAAIPLVGVRAAYEHSLFAYCCSKVKVPTPADGGQRRFMVVASAANMEELRNILPEQFKSAGDKSLIKAKARARKQALETLCTRIKENALLQLALLTTKTIVEFKSLLQRSTLVGISSVVKQLTDSEFAELQESMQTKDLNQLAVYATGMAKLAKCDSVPGDFAAKTGVALEEGEWSKLQGQFHDQAYGDYKKSTKSIVFHLVEQLPREHALAHYYKRRIENAIGNNLAGWQQLARQASFSLALVYAHEDYLEKKGVDKVNAQYEQYVFEQPERHTLAGLCDKVSECSGQFGRLHKNSFFIQVLEQRGVPWHGGVFVPLLDELPGVYENRLYLPEGSGQERAGGGFFKPASRVARDSILAVVKEYAANNPLITNESEQSTGLNTPLCR